MMTRGIDGRIRKLEERRGPGRIIVINQLEEGDGLPYENGKALTPAEFAAAQADGNNTIIRLVDSEVGHDDRGD